MDREQGTQFTRRMKVHRCLVREACQCAAACMLTTVVPYGKLVCTYTCMLDLVPNEGGGSGWIIGAGGGAGRLDSVRKPKFMWLLTVVLWAATARGHLPTQVLRDKPAFRAIRNVLPGAGNAVE